MTEEFGCSVIYQNAAVVKLKRLGASDCTRTQFTEVAEQMYVKIGGLQAYGKYRYSQIRVETRRRHIWRLQQIHKETDILLLHDSLFRNITICI